MKWNLRILFGCCKIKNLKSIVQQRVFIDFKLQFVLCHTRVWLKAKPIWVILDHKLFRNFFTTILMWQECKSIHIQEFYPILFYHPKKLLYQLHNTILQYIQHLNFYFLILLIKIIFLHNKIIYPKIIFIYNTTHYLFFLSHSFCSRTTTNLLKPPSLQAHHCYTTHTWHHHHQQPIIYHQHQKKKKRKKKKWRDYSTNPPSTPNAATHGPYHREQNPNP